MATFLIDGGYFGRRFLKHNYSKNKRKYEFGGWITSNLETAAKKRCWKKIVKGYLNMI